MSVMICILITGMRLLGRLGMCLLGSILYKRYGISWAKTYHGATSRILSQNALIKSGENTK